MRFRLFLIILMRMRGGSGGDEDEGGKVVAPVGDFGGGSGGRVSSGSIESRFRDVVKHGGGGEAV